MSETVLPLPRQTLKVGELTRYLKYLVETDEVLSQLSVQGEISDLSRAPSGHLYFTLRDPQSQIACVLFRREAAQQAQQVKELRTGISVVVNGFVTLYEPRGTYQIYVERVTVQGEGALARRFEKLREKLETEGLFAPERKRTLPSFPRTVALITSPGSQAYHDVLHRLRSQYPFVRVIEAGASVQGEGAADEMAMAIDILNRLTNAEVILLVRGGGSPEELAAFNEERLARAIFASRVPVVTGIGHETDYTIADFVADVRAATPSLAAAVAVPDAGALVQRIGQLHRACTATMRHRLRLERNRWLEQNRALLRANPETRLKERRRRGKELAWTMRRAMESHLRSKRVRLDALTAQLQALDPLAVLNRGYSVLTDPANGRVVSRVDQVSAGSLLRARLSNGELLVRVEQP